MENKMQVFENEEFGEIRTMLIDSEPWFVGKDVALALGYKDTNNALKAHVDEDDKRGWRIATPSGIQQMTVINESGLYSLILSSKLPSAKRFKRWVTGEVLPSIRKHGGYLTDDLLNQAAEDPAAMERFAKSLLAERRRTKEMESLLVETIPKAAYYDAFVNPADATNIRNTAKELGIPQQTFCKLLLDWKLLYRDQQYRLMPYAEPAKKGYFIVRDFCRNGHVGCYTLITAKGKEYLRKRLSAEGLLAA